MIPFDRCDIAFDDSGRGKLKDGRQVLAEVDYFLYYDKILESDQAMKQEFDGNQDVFGQFETVDCIPVVKKHGHYMLCLQSKLELEIEVDFIYQPGINSVSCEFSVVGDSLKKFYELTS